MFVQVIEGKTSNPEGFGRNSKWVAELQPGAKGYVGTTAGVAADGRVVAFARFESEDGRGRTATAPSKAWWAETELLDGPVEFSESSDVTNFLAGGSDDAGFVQFMKVAGVDVAQRWSKVTSSSSRWLPSCGPT